MKEYSILSRSPELEHQVQIRLRIIPKTMDLNHVITLSYGLHSANIVSSKIVFALNNPRRLICHYTKMLNVTKTRSWDINGNNIMNTKNNENHYFTLSRVFHASVSWWFSSGAWVTASLLRSPGHFSVFGPILIML